MIILLDTSTPICQLRIVDGSQQYDDVWQADRTLAKGLLLYLKQQLAVHGAQFTDIVGIGVMQGPGSFTGLRIGLTVLNTIADSQQIPIVGVTGDDWQTMALQRLKSGEDDCIVLPFYGGEAHITAPRK